MKLKAPFVYFGGKSTVAQIVWKALGKDIRNYFEPFFGSGAVLLQRPDYDQTKHTETINDKDGFIANVWRSLQFNPDETAKWCDWPVNHADLSARKKKLIEQESYLLENLIADPDWHDPKLAGYWIWAASCWIGSGLTRPGSIPHLTSSGQGVHKIGQIPHLTSSGQGVHKIGQIPHLAGSGRGVHKAHNTNMYEWFRNLSERLRYVRVVCGDWTRICQGNWQDGKGVVGFFFDPPYGVLDRDTDVYHHDGTDIAGGVLEWCKVRGKRKKYRIVVAGYGEYQELVDDYGWRSQGWKAAGGYGNNNKNGNQNRHRETLYFSPYCINQAQRQFNFD